MKKLFVAIATHEGLEEPSSTAAQILKKLRTNADQRELEVRWIPPANYHVTVLFLGPTPTDKIPEIQEVLQTVAAGAAPFTLKISDVGAFPDEFSSRVLWFGVQNSRSLRGLQMRLQEAFQEKKYVLNERDYLPHLTIARLRNPHRTKDLTSPFTRKKIAKIAVHEIVLYESINTVPFPVYKALVRVPLTGAPEEFSEPSFSEAD